VLRRVSKRREVSSVVCLTAPLGGRPPRLFARHFLGTVHAPELITAVRYFQRRLGGGPLILVLDRLNVHRARVTQAFFARHCDEFLLEWLPSYAPELNPDEQCNGWVKRDTLNALPASDGELRRVARRGFQRLARQPPVMRQFFAHAGLSVT
jgi:transposase